MTAARSPVRRAKPPDTQHRRPHVTCCSRNAYATAVARTAGYLSRREPARSRLAAHLVLQIARTRNAPSQKATLSAPRRFTRPGPIQQSSRRVLRRPATIDVHDRVGDIRVAGPYRRRTTAPPRTHSSRLGRPDDRVARIASGGPCPLDSSRLGSTSGQLAPPGRAASHDWINSAHCATPVSSAPCPPGCLSCADGPRSRLRERMPGALRRARRRRAPRATLAADRANWHPPARSRRSHPRP